jgi:hypothetical protein
MCSCTASKDSKDSLINSGASDSATHDNDDFPDNGKSAQRLFDKDKDFRILNASRDITNQSSARDTTMCKGWTVEKQNIATIIKECEAIDASGWHHLFDVLPCIIKGQIIQDGLTFGFEMNAGSWLYISSGDTTVLLGSFEKKNEKYFVSSAMIGE